jgi:adenylate cyclase
MSFLDELKRRKVFRVAAVYGAAAFAVVQAADLVFPRLALPDWTVTLVVVLALLGLPLALGLAWAFEATPEGLRRTMPPAPGQAVEPSARRWRAAAAAMVGILLLGGGAWWTLAGAGSRATTYDSIAVLPFANLSGDPAYEYFGDGLAEELLNALSAVEGMKVVARTSAFALKGSGLDVRAIGDTLRVSAVLEGSVRRSADHVRISAQLIDVRSGYRLWSETYDRPLADLFAVQDAIAGEIMRALSVRLASDGSTEELHRGGTRDVEAYDLYLLGRQKWATREIPLLWEAVAHFQEAIARDSSFALAWSGFSDAINALAWRRDTTALVRVEEAKLAATRAILLDPGLAEGWASLGVMLLEFGYDFRFAEAALRRALELKPSYSFALQSYGATLLHSGRPQEAAVAFQRGVGLVPLAPGRQGLALTYMALGRWNEARDEWLRYREFGFASLSTASVRLVSLAPRYGFTPEQTALYATEWAELGGYASPDEAAVIGRAIFDPALRDEARTVLRRMEAEDLAARELAELHLVLGDPDAAIALLQRAVTERDPTLIQLGIDPTFDPLRTDPRFISMLDALHLPNGVRP